MLKRFLFILLVAGCHGAPTAGGAPDLASAWPGSIGVPDLAVSVGVDMAGVDLAMTGDLQPPANCVAANRSVVHFVDPMYGRDDNMHGGGAGACAYKTLTFALPRADGEISLADAAYGEPAESSTYTLNGTQHLSCNGATLLGPVDFKGTANGLDHCYVDGMSADDCVTIYQVPMASHSISNSTIRNCRTAGIFVADGFLSLDNSTISGAGYGIEWFDSRTIAGSMVNNHFDYDETGIQCDITTSEITGSGNQFNNTNLECHGCEGCPYD